MGNSIFEALDLSGDARLSAREMQTAGNQLLILDKNKDGRITQEEIPVSITVKFRIGYVYNYGRPVSGVNSQPAQNPKSKAPEWFTRMDRNGDGDLTLKEFLGDKEQFQTLDKNKDGFIEPKEAETGEK